MEGYPGGESKITDQRLQKEKGSEGRWVGSMIAPRGVCCIIDGSNSLFTSVHSLRMAQNVILHFSVM
jgi:hypothetical protein